MKKSFFLLLLFSILAVSPNIFAVNENFSDLRALMDSYFNADGSLNSAGLTQVSYANSYASEIPEPVKAVFGNETINIEISFEDASKEIIGIQTKNAQIVVAKKSSFSNPTMNVSVSEKTVKKILSNENRINGFANAYFAGEIKYEALGIIPSIKKSIVDSVISIFRLFSFFNTGRFLFPFP